MDKMKRISLPVLIPLVIVLAFSSCTGGGEHFDPQRFEDLIGKNVSLIEGSLHADYVSKNLKDLDVKWQFYPTSTECLISVELGKVDAYFGTDIQTFSESFDELNLRVSKTFDDIFAPYAYGIGKQNSELRNDLDAFLDSLKQRGEIYEIVHRWIDNSTGDYHDCLRVDPIPQNQSGTGKTIVVGNCGVEPPSCLLMENGWTGYEMEILARYAIDRGYSLEIHPYDFHNLIPALQTGAIDIGSSNFIITEERMEKIDFTVPIDSTRAVLIVKDYDSETEAGFWDSVKNNINKSLVKEQRWKLIASGLWTTVLITVLSLFFGAILGGFVCWMRMNRRRSLQGVARFYIFLMRNTPMLVFLMIMFYIVFANSGFSAVGVAIVAFSLNSAAFTSEIFRTGIESIDRSQLEAGQGMGCTPFQIFYHIIAPQALRRIIPVYKNESVNVLKATSIVGYISIIDLTKSSDLIRSSTFEAFFPLIIITLLYFILAAILTLTIEKLLNRRRF